MPQMLAAYPDAIDPDHHLNGVGGGDAGKHPLRFVRAIVRQGVDFDRTLEGKEGSEGGREGRMV